MVFLGFKIRRRSTDKVLKASRQFFSFSESRALWHIYRCTKNLEDWVR